MNYAPFLLAALLAAGCSRYDDTSVKKQLSDQEAEIGHLTQLLNESIKESDAAVRKLQLQEVALSGQLDTDRMRIDTALAPRPAILSPSSKGFDICRNLYGSCAISIESVEPYLTGFKVNLSIGNMAAGDLTAGSIDVAFNRKAPEQSGSDAASFAAWTKEYGDWAKHERDAITTIAQPIKSGCWNRFQVIIDQAKPEDLDTLKVMVLPEGVSLHPPRT